MPNLLDYLRPSSVSPALLNPSAAAILAARNNAFGAPTPEKTPDYMTPGGAKKTGMAGIDPMTWLAISGALFEGGRKGGKISDAMYGIAGALQTQKDKRDKDGLSDAQRRAALAMQSGDMDGAVKILSGARGGEDDALKLQLQRRAEDKDETRYQQKRDDDLTKPIPVGPGDHLAQRKPGGGFEDVFSSPLRPTADKGLQHVELDNGFLGVFDPATGDITPTKFKYRPPSAGVTINMPANIREGVDANGNPVFAGIDPKDPHGGFKAVSGITPQQQLMGADTKAKFMALAPNAYAGLGRLQTLFSDPKTNPFAGVKGTGAQLLNGLPVPGADIGAKLLGGQNWQDFDQSWNAIELGVHIPAGANVTPSEATRYIRSNKPTIGDSDVTIQTKLENIQRFYDGLDAGFRGDMSALQSILKPPADTKADVHLDEEDQAAVAELRRRGVPEDEIQKLIRGQ